MYVCMLYVCMYVRMYVCKYVCMYVYINIYIHTTMSILVQSKVFYRAYCVLLHRVPVVLLILLT